MPSFFGVVRSKIAGIVPMRTMITLTIATRLTRPLSRVMARCRDDTSRGAERKANCALCLAIRACFGLSCYTASPSPHLRRALLNARRAPGPRGGERTG